MGYNTSFDGSVEIRPPLKPEHGEDLQAFMDYEESPGPGKDDDDPRSALAECPWHYYPDESCLLPPDDGRGYDTEEWLALLVEKIAEWGYSCSGLVEAAGEDADDFWRMVVTDNVVTSQNGGIVYGETARPPLLVVLEAGECAAIIDDDGQEVPSQVLDLDLNPADDVAPEARGFVLAELRLVRDKPAWRTALERAGRRDKLDVLIEGLAELVDD